MDELLKMGTKVLVYETREIGHVIGHSYGQNVIETRKNITQMSNLNFEVV